MTTMKRVDETRVRFDSATQLDTVKKAAKLKKWSVNRFLIEAGLSAAKSVMANPASGQLMVGSDPLPLNQ